MNYIFDELRILLFVSLDDRSKVKIGRRKERLVDDDGGWGRMVPAGGGCGTGGQQQGCRSAARAGAGETGR
jgi:hypothetical protein